MVNQYIATIKSTEAAILLQWLLSSVTHNGIIKCNIHRDFGTYCVFCWNRTISVRHYNGKSQAYMRCVENHPNQRLSRQRQQIQMLPIPQKSIKPVNLQAPWTHHAKVHRTNIPKCTILHTRAHISVTKWCIVRFWTGVFGDSCNRPIDPRAGLPSKHLRKWQTFRLTLLWKARAMEKGWTICDSRSSEEIIVKNEFNKTLTINNQMIWIIWIEITKYLIAWKTTPLNLAIEIFAFLCQIKISLLM